VHAVIRGADSPVTSAGSLGDVSCVASTHAEGLLSPAPFRELARAFRKHVDAGVWTLTPLTEALLQLMSSLVISAPAARDLGEREIWTNDRHMLAADPYFGLAGRSV
jgi:hypothetical protein